MYMCNFFRYCCFSCIEKIVLDISYFSLKRKCAVDINLFIVLLREEIIDMIETQQKNNNLFKFNTYRMSVCMNISRMEKLYPKYREVLNIHKENFYINKYNEFNFKKMINQENDDFVLFLIRIACDLPIK